MELWKKWLKGDSKKRLNFLLILGGVGVGVMLFSSFMQPKKTEWSMEPTTPSLMGGEEKQVQTESKMSQIEQYEKRFEKQLEEVLSKIVGVDDVSVIVNLESTEEEVVQLDVRESEQVTTEKDKNGGNRSITQNTLDKKTAYYRGEGGDKPIVVKKIKPRVRGVLVVARGVENLQVKAIVMEAVQRTLEVPYHRISVLPKG